MAEKDRTRQSVTPLTSDRCHPDLDELEMRLEKQLTFFMMDSDSEICPYYICNPFCGGGTTKCYPYCSPDA